MFNKSQLFFLIFFLFSIQLSIGQNNTNSPYTRYGYGELIDSHSGEQKGMGGVALGFRKGSSINTINPASYSAVDTMNFMFDVGLSGLLTRFSEQGNHKNTFNSNLEYVTMQFPISNSIGFSAGLLPYSFSGYNFTQSDSIEIAGNPSGQYARYSKSFIGSGGISQVYGGLGFKFLDHISVGVNAYYMFGEVSNSRINTFSNSGFASSTQQNSIIVSNFRFRYGLQLYNTFADKHEITLGAIYEVKAPFNGSFKQINLSVPADTLNFDNDFDMPTTLGVGLQYNLDNRLSVGIDYTMQQWADARYFGVTDSLRNRSKLSVGGEYIPNPRGNSYLDRVRYRAGFNISDPYYKIPGVAPVKNFGISFGVGLPLRTSKTMVNATVEYGKSGDASLFREDYFKFTFNATFNESWFFKRKL